MSNLKMFFPEVAEKPKLQDFFVVSNRFKDEEGESIEWRLKILTANELSKLSSASIKTDPKKKLEVDMDVYQKAMVVACVEYPDLSNAELQDAYQVKNEVELLNKMLTGPEYQRLLVRVNDLHGTDLDLEELKDEAKNL